MAIKFIADSMLGKLARWLRLMGFDTLYYPSIPDEDLVKKAKEEGRVILTKDNELACRNKGENLLFLSSSDPYEQLKIVIRTLNLNPWEGLFSRCVYCNKIVKKVNDNSKIKNLVPSYAYRNSSSFYQCPECGRLYWEGSHHNKIREKIKSLLKEENEI